MTSTMVARILSGIAPESTSPSQLPQRLVLACADELAVTGVGMILMTDAGPAGIVAATDGPAATMEDLQFTLGEGPCVDCSRSGRPVLLPDLARSGPGRWPAFSAGALDAGIRAIFALPLRIGGIRLGVLDLYRDTAGTLSEQELETALAFADAATAVLLQLQARESADEEQLVRPIPVLEDRAVVHQATGMVAVQAGRTLAEALVLLRARAYASERPIADVAYDVLNGGVHFQNESREHE